MLEDIERNAGQEALKGSLGLARREVQGTATHSPAVQGFMYTVLAAGLCWTRLNQRDWAMEMKVVPSPLPQNSRPKNQPVLHLFLL